VYSEKLVKIIRKIFKRAPPPPYDNTENDAFMHEEEVDAADAEDDDDDVRSVALDEFVDEAFEEQEDTQRARAQVEMVAEEEMALDEGRPIPRVVDDDIDMGDNPGPSYDDVPRQRGIDWTASKIPADKSPAHKAPLKRGRDEAEDSAADTSHDSSMEVATQGSAKRPPRTPPPTREVHVIHPRPTTPGRPQNGGGFPNKARSQTPSALRQQAAQAQEHQSVTPGRVVYSPTRNTPRRHESRSQSRHSRAPTPQRRDPTPHRYASTTNADFHYDQQPETSRRQERSQSRHSRAPTPRNTFDFGAPSIYGPGQERPESRHSRAPSAFGAPSFGPQAGSSTANTGDQGFRSNDNNTGFGDQGGFSRSGNRGNFRQQRSSSFNDGQRNNGFAHPGFVPRSDVTCYQCKQTGHFARDCKKKTFLPRKLYTLGIERQQQRQQHQERMGERAEHRRGFYDDVSRLRIDDKSKVNVAKEIITTVRVTNF